MISSGIARDRVMIDRFGREGPWSTSAYNSSRTESQSVKLVLGDRSGRNGRVLVVGYFSQSLPVEERVAAAGRADLYPSSMVGL